MSTLIDAVMFPIPPTANMYWRTRIIRSRNPSPKQMRMSGGYMAVTYLSKDAKQYSEVINDRVREKGLAHMSGQILEAEIVVCPASKRRQDMDNRVKPLFDALKNAKVFEDDCQIWRFKVERGPIIKGGRVIVTLREIMPDDHGALQRIGWNGS